MCKELATMVKIGVGRGSGKNAKPNLAIDFVLRHNKNKNNKNGQLKKCSVVKEKV